MTVKVCYVYVISDKDKPTVYYALEDDKQDQIIVDERSTAEIYIAGYATPLPGGIKRGIIDTNKLFLDGVQLERTNNNIIKVTLEEMFNHARGVSVHGNKFEVVVVPLVPTDSNQVYKLDNERDWYGTKAHAAKFLSMMTPPKGCKFSLVTAAKYAEMNLPKITKAIIASLTKSTPANNICTTPVAVATPNVVNTDSPVQPVSSQTTETQDGPNVTSCIRVNLLSKETTDIKPLPTPPTLSLKPSLSKAKVDTRQK
jgi:hypothetical protein